MAAKDKNTRLKPNNTIAILPQTGVGCLGDPVSFLHCKEPQSEHEWIFLVLAVLGSDEARRWKPSMAIGSMNATCSNCTAAGSASMRRNGLSTGADWLSRCAASSRLRYRCATATEAAVCAPCRAGCHHWANGDDAKDGYPPSSFS